MKLLDKICTKFLEIMCSEKLMMILIFLAFVGMGYMLSSVLIELIF